jgi:hypothetical protein
MVASSIYFERLEGLSREHPHLKQPLVKTPEHALKNSEIADVAETVK